MRRGAIGGGDTQTGLIYDAKVDLAIFLNNQIGYRVENMDIFFNGELVGNIFKDTVCIVSFVKKVLI